MSSSREQVLRKLQNKEYRDSFVSELIYSHIPLKIRALRDQRGMTQKQLGEQARMAQTWVSKLEDPNYGKLTISTLLRLASAFDVGLLIDFVPFSALLDSALTLSPDSFHVHSFVSDQGLSGQVEDTRYLREVVVSLTEGRNAQDLAISAKDTLFNESSGNIQAELPSRSIGAVAYSQA